MVSRTKLVSRTVVILQSVRHTTFSLSFIGIELVTLDATRANPATTQLGVFGSNPLTTMVVVTLHLEGLDPLAGDVLAVVH